MYRHVKAGARKCNLGGEVGQNNRRGITLQLMCNVEEFEVRALCLRRNANRAAFEQCVLIEKRKLN